MGDTVDMLEASSHSVPIDEDDEQLQKLLVDLPGAEAISAQLKQTEKALEELRATGGITSDQVLSLEAAKPGIIFDKYPPGGYNDKPNTENYQFVMESLGTQQYLLIGAGLVAVLGIIYRFFFSGGGSGGAAFSSGSGDPLSATTSPEEGKRIIQQTLDSAERASDALADGGVGTAPKPHEAVSLLKRIGYPRLNEIEAAAARGDLGISTIDVPLMDKAMAMHFFGRFAPICYLGQRDTFSPELVRDIGEILISKLDNRIESTERFVNDFITRIDGIGGTGRINYNANEVPNSLRPYSVNEDHSEWVFITQTLSQHAPGLVHVPTDQELHDPHERRRMILDVISAFKLCWSSSIDPIPENLIKGVIDKDFGSMSKIKTQITHFFNELPQFKKTMLEMSRRHKDAERKLGAALEKATFEYQRHERYMRDEGQRHGEPTVGTTVAYTLFKEYKDELDIQRELLALDVRVMISYVGLMRRFWQGLKQMEHTLLSLQKALIPK